MEKPVSAAALLQELRENGIQLSLADGELELHPYSRVTQDQIVDLGSNGQVLEQLVQLQEGQQALDADHEAFLKGGGSEEFGTEFDLWYAREQMLRNVLAYRGCIWGAAAECPNTVVRCSSCTSISKRRYKSL